MNILYIDIDTLRADHMGCYGYHRNTTPNLDTVAQEGIRLENYYCSDAPCLPSRSALSSGMFGIHTGAVGHTGTNGDRRLTGKARAFRDQMDDFNYHNVFRKAGYHTASISTFAERHSSWWFNAGFNEIYNVGKQGGEIAEQVIPVALNWLDRNSSDDKWYLHLHLWDPHTPYRTPAAFGNPFENDPLPEWITDEVFQEHCKLTGPHGLNEFNMYHDIENPKLPRQPGKALDKDGLRRIFDGYDCGVAYADQMLGQIFRKLKEKGIYNNTAIIISADHGENFGELGIYGEHATADYPTCRLPMIVKWPGGAKGVDVGLHYNLDLAPTMAELLGVSPSPNWDGTSFADTILNGTTQGHDYLVLSQMAHVCQRSVRFDDFLYLRTYHDGFHTNIEREMLFNVKEDPYEQYNLVRERPDLCARAAKMLLDWQDTNMMSSNYNTDPLWEVMKEGGPSHCRGELHNYLLRLENTNRAEGAAELRKRHPGEY